MNRRKTVKIKILTQSSARNYGRFFVKALDGTFSTGLIMDMTITISASINAVKQLKI